MPFLFKLLLLILYNKMFVLLNKKYYIWEAALSLLQVSSNIESKVSSVTSLSFLSASTSPFIFVIITRSISKIASSVSSLVFLSSEQIDCSLFISSKIFFEIVSSFCCRSPCSNLTRPWSFGKSFSRYVLRFSMHS